MRGSTKRIVDFVPTGDCKLRVNRQLSARATSARNLLRGKAAICRLLFCPRESPEGDWGGIN